jgi:hypothetical protein
VSCNLWPIGHYSDFGVDRAAFLYALATEVPIDFASHAIWLMLAAFEDGNLSLPFGGLISHIFAHLGLNQKKVNLLSPPLHLSIRGPFPNHQDKLIAILGDKLQPEI